MACSQGVMLIFMAGFYEEFTLSKPLLCSVFQGKVRDRLSHGYFFFLFISPTYNTSCITINSVSSNLFHLKNWIHSFFPPNFKGWTFIFLWALLFLLVTVAGISSLVSNDFSVLRETDDLLDVRGHLKHFQLSIFNSCSFLWFAFHYSFPQPFSLASLLLTNKHFSIFYNHLFLFFQLPLLQCHLCVWLCPYVFAEPMRNSDCCSSWSYTLFLQSFVCFFMSHLAGAQSLLLSLIFCGITPFFMCQFKGSSLLWGTLPVIFLASEIPSQAIRYLFFNTQLKVIKSSHPWSHGWNVISITDSRTNLVMCQPPSVSPGEVSGHQIKVSWGQVLLLWSFVPQTFWREWYM